MVFYFHVMHAQGTSATQEHISLRFRCDFAQKLLFYRLGHSLEGSHAGYKPGTLQVLAIRRHLHLKNQTKT